MFGMRPAPFFDARAVFRNPDAVRTLKSLPFADQFLIWELSQSFSFFLSIEFSFFLTFKNPLNLRPSISLKP